MGGRRLPSACQLGKAIEWQLPPHLQAYCKVNATFCKHSIIGMRVAASRSVYFCVKETLASESYVHSIRFFLIC